MTREELKEKYPKMFEECFDFSIGPGWMPLIETFCLSVYHSEMRAKEYVETARKHSHKWDNGEQRLAEAEADYKTVTEYPTRIVQVKEKFGGLRLYHHGGLLKFFDYARFAENLSYKLCEDCGVRAEVRTDGWIRTLCRACGEKIVAKHPNTKLTEIDENSD